MNSLFIVGLPRSLTSVTYHLARKALGLQQPGWVTDGELLNTHRYLFAPASETSRFITAKEFSTQFNAASSYLTASVQLQNYIYKDATQPFVISDYLTKTEITIIHIKRSVVDVALRMFRQGWLAPDQSLLTTLFHAQQSLIQIPHAFEVDFDQVIFDESVLSEAIGVEVSYLTDEFKHKRDSTLDLRDSDEYKVLAGCYANLQSQADLKSPEPVCLKIDRSSRKVVMLVSDAQAPTGFTRVGYEIAKSLHTEFDLHQIGINYFGNEQHLPWSIYPAQVESMALEDRIAAITSLVQPDIIILLNDPWVVSKQTQNLKTHNYEGKIIGYCPVDGAPLPVSCATGLGQLDLLIAYTAFGQQAFVELFKPEKIDSPALTVIPHGVDSNVFDRLIPDDPQASRQAAKAQIFPSEPKFLDSFVVLNGNRNQPRKRVDITMRAFAEFAEDKPDNVLLYLHMARTDFGWDVVALAERFGITDRLIMSTNDNQMPHLSEKDLNLMYNACDVGLNTSCAEGWGLVSFEHAATGAVQVLPKTETQEELWGGIAELVPPSMTTTAIGQVADWHLVSPNDVAQVLERLYQNSKQTSRLADRCRDHARQKKFNWQRIGKSWIHNVRAVLQQNSNLKQTLPRNTKLPQL